MTYTAENIQVLTGLDAVRKRPGMYLGDTGRLGATRLIQSAIDTLTELTVCREPRLWYSHYAFLDMTLHDRLVTATIDYHPSECPDIDTRCQSLAANRENLRRYPYSLDQTINAVSNIAVLSALSTGLHICRADHTILTSPDAKAFDLPIATKGDIVAAHFRIGDQIDTEGLTLDYLTGFLEGTRSVPGLVLRTVTMGKAGKSA